MPDGEEERRGERRNEVRKVPPAELALTQDTQAKDATVLGEDPTAEHVVEHGFPISGGRSGASWSPSMPRRGPRIFSRSRSWRSRYSSAESAGPNPARLGTPLMCGAEDREAVLDHMLGRGILAEDGGILGLGVRVSASSAGGTLRTSLRRSPRRSCSPSGTAPLISAPCTPLVARRARRGARTLTRRTELEGDRR